MAYWLGKAARELVATYLDHFIKPYVENFDSNKLDFGNVMEGVVTFRNLRIKKGALDKFRLPVDVIEGNLGRLDMKIPFFYLGSRPVEVTIEDLYLLVVPASESKVDLEEDERRAQAAKQERLSSAELIQSRSKMDMPSSEDDQKQKAVNDSITNKVINNLQITVRNVHIRYEDKLSVPDHPFAAGVTLREFSAQTTDGEWKPTFIQSSAGAIHKLGKLESLALYFNTDAESISGLQVDESIETFRSLIARGSHTPKHQYILRPVTGEARIIIHHKIDNQTPRFDAQVLFDELGFVVDDEQYRDAISMIDMYHFYVRQAQYRKYKPSEEQLKENRAKALLKFAGDSILREIHEKNKKWTWDYLRERRDDRHKYVELFKRKQDGPPLNVTETNNLNALEEKLSYEDIRFYRSIAKSQLKKERANRKRAEVQKQQEHAAASKAKGGGWLSWAWGGGASQPVESGEASEDGLTDEQRKELYQAIDYDEKQALTDYMETPDAMKVRASVSLKKGWFSLRKEPHLNEGEGVEMMSIVYEDFKAEVLQRAESLETVLTLGGLSVFDNTSPGTLYNRIVKVKDETEAISKPEGDLVGLEVGAEGATEESKEKAATDALFYLKFEQNPLDQRADNGITIHMKAMEIIYHKGYVEAIYDFLKPPESQMESVNALLHAATETLGELRDQTRAGLEYALQTHRTVDIKLDMASPIVIIPEDVRTKQCQHIILDAGRISIRSDLVEKATMQEIQAKRKMKYTEQDFEKLESLMYDKFFLKLESAQLVIGSDMETSLRALASEDEAGRELHLLERINMEFSVQTSIVPDALNLARFKVAGKLPSLNINFSTAKYKSMMRMIDVAIPKLGDEEKKPDVATIKTSTARPDAFKLPSNVFSRAKEYNIDVAEVDHTGTTTPVAPVEDDATSDDDDEDDAETFVDAEGDTQSLRAIHQHLFEFTFQVEKLQATLLKSPGGEEPEKVLSDVTLAGFSLAFVLTKFDMGVDVWLKSLSAHMIDSNSTKTPLLESSDLSSLAKNDEGKIRELVHIKYSRVQANSPEYMTVHEGVDQSVDVALSTIILSVAPEPIIALYDFIMSTFVDRPNGSSPATPALESSESEAVPAQPTAPPPDSGKIKVRVNMTSIQMILMDAGRRLATLSLSAADVVVFLRGNTMRVGARLGNLSLSDDSPITPADPSFKSLISIEGDELADFSYETFDPEDKVTFPGVNSSVYLRTGSLKATFLEEPLHDIYGFLIKFAKLKSLYDQATQVAVQKASEIERMKFDVVVKSPILLLPCSPSDSGDLLVMKLGEIQASNSYVGPVGTIKAGLHGIRLTSRMMHKGERCKLKIIEDVGISAEIIQTSDIDRSVELLKPDSEIKVTMSDVKIALTQAQYLALLNISQAIPRVLASAEDATESAVQSAESQIPSTNPSQHPSKPSTPQPTVDLGPELGLTAHDKSGEDIPRWSTVDVVFTVNAVRLQLFDSSATDESSLKECGIARFSLNNNSVRFKMLSDGATQTEVILKSFTINNTRAGASRFREIIPAAQHSRNQFMVLFTTVGGPQPSSSIVVSIDSPKVIFSVDPVFALLDFFTSGTPQAPMERHADEDEDSKIEQSTVESSQMSMRVDVHEISISVLESDSNPNSQAIQLSIREILMSQQGILALSINQLGMSLMSMNKPSDHVSFLDDIDITLSLDSRQSSGQQMTSIEITSQPIIFRASYRDINLIMTIVNKALELSANRSSSPTQSNKPSKSRSQLPSGPAKRRSRKSTGVHKSKKAATSPAKVIMSKEKLKASFDGFRLVLIGDQHELPLLHLKTKPFTLSATDWTGELQAYTTFHTYIAYWNLTNSHWEPLIDPWTFAISVTKDSPSGALNTTISSQEMLDINLTTTFMETALTTMKVWSKEGDRLLKTGRGGDAPYRIINETGTVIHVWSEAGERVANPPQTTKLSNGESIDWRFDDWRTMRERVASSRNNSIAVQFEGKTWEQVHNIPVDREGEFVYALRPKIDKVADRLLCEVVVKDNIKVVILRSTYKIENRTLYPVDLVLVDAKGKPTHPLQKLSPGQDYSLPIDAVLHHDIQLRPDPGFGYSWPDRPIKWESLIRSPSMTIKCPFHQRGAEVPFHFQAWAIYDPSDPINKSYPKITLRLHAPIELENLLPYDIRYCFYDKDHEKHWRSFLRKGGLMPIHCVHLDQFVLFNLEIQDSVFKPSEFAIVNTDDSSDFSIEHTITLTDQENRKLNLGINYDKHEDSGGAFRIQVYSPYIAINKTGMPIELRASNGKAVAGQTGNDALTDPTPFMFSHPREQGAEFTARVGKSQLSRVLNFDAPSADTAICLPSATPNGKELHVGISWAAGLGKYKLSKVITFAPRFLIRNELDQELSFRECGDRSSGAPMKPNTEVPIHAFQPGRDPSLSLKYPGVGSEWSAPINLQHVGVIHVRMSKEGQSKPDLARVEISIALSTIWVVVKKETGPWPFSIENQSDYLVSFFQVDDRPTNPNISYIVQPHHVLPYSWDAPAAGEKRLNLVLEGQNRTVDVMEIGDLVPFKFQTNRGSKVVSLDVRADGATQILCISNYVEDMSLYKRRPRSTEGSLSRSNTLSSQAETFEAVTEEITPSLSVNIDFEGIGISLVNKRMVEVVYFTLSKLKVEYTDSEVAQAVNLACGWVQIDNQLHEAIYPIVLQPMVVTGEGNGIDVLPAIQGSIIVLKDQSHGVLFVKYLSVLLQAFTVQMDEDFLFALLDLTKMKALSWEEEEEDMLTEYPVDLPRPRPIEEGQDIYFEVLELQPIRLSLSFMRTERVNADEKLTLRNPLTVVLNAFTMTIGNINDAPLRLNALAIKDMRLTVSILQERIIYHYKQEVIRQLYRVLGSADFIGNPVGLFTNVSSGVADIFYEPYKGVVMHGSKELGIGIAKGAASFAKKTVFGLTDSMTKFTSSIGKGLSAATFDAEYQRQRRLAQRKNKPRHAIYGVTAGAEALATSFTSGIEGVVMKPLEGAETGGAVGFFKGIGKGLVGAITKPAVGVFDLAANFTEGIRNTTTVFDNDQRNRKRIPRHVPKDGILTPYSQREAVGQGWMKDLENGKYRSEYYVAHLSLPEGDRVLMLTNSRVLEFFSTSLRLRWEMPFRHLERVMILDTGIRFADKAGKEYDRFVIIPDSKAKSWFFQELEKVIKQWNADRRVER
ncbi:hypothetical protein FRC03_003482 [Tulasnella sp. 419]|nr:hypothetical protein FRC03_003482 [Tulasnella sp. 419]